MNAQTARVHLLKLLGPLGFQVEVAQVQIDRAHCVHVEVLHTSTQHKFVCTLSSHELAVEHMAKSRLMYVAVDIIEELLSKLAKT